MTSIIFLFKALGEETKHKILRTILDGEICACKIPSKIGRTQSNTSMHLAKLVEWDLVQSRRKGKMILYSIKDRRVFNVFRAIEIGGEK